MCDNIIVLRRKPNASATDNVHVDEGGGVTRRLQTLLVDDDKLNQAIAVVVVGGREDYTDVPHDELASRVRSAIRPLSRIAESAAPHVRFLVRNTVDTMRQVLPGQLPRKTSLDLRQIVTDEISWLAPAQVYLWESPEDLRSCLHSLGAETRRGGSGCNEAELRELLGSVSQTELVGLAQTFYDGDGVECGGGVVTVMDMQSMFPSAPALQCERVLQLVAQCCGGGHGDDKASGGDGVSLMPLLSVLSRYCGGGTGDNNVDVGAADDDEGCAFRTAVKGHLASHSHETIVTRLARRLDRPRCFLMVPPGLGTTTIDAYRDLTSSSSPYSITTTKWDDDIAVEIIRTVDQNSDMAHHLRENQLDIPPVDECRTIAFPLTKPLPATSYMDTVTDDGSFAIDRMKPVVTVSQRESCLKVQCTSDDRGQPIPAAEYIMALLPHELRAMDFFDTTSAFPMADRTFDGQEALLASSSAQDDLTLSRHRTCYAILRATHEKTKELHHLRTAFTNVLQPLRDEEKSTSLKLRAEPQQQRDSDAELMAMQQLLSHLQRSMQQELHSFANALKSSRHNEALSLAPPPPSFPQRRGRPPLYGMSMPAACHSRSSPPR